MRITKLDHRHTSKVFALLLNDIDANLFLIDILMRRGISSWGTEEWRGIINGENLLAIAVSMGRLRPKTQSRLVFSYGDPTACELLGKVEKEKGETRMILGPRAPSDGIWFGMGKPTPRINYDQRLYACDKPAAGKKLELRYAQPADLDKIANHSANMILEDLLEDPREVDPKLHIASVKHRIKHKKTLVGEKNGKICFLLDIGTYFNLGSQVGGTYVPPEFRGEGIASAGMRAACHQLLQNSKKVTLHVHELNIAAIRLYQKVGFYSSSAYRLISFHPKNKNV